AEGLFLNKIGAERSPVSRPESDCWDVVLEFFNPKERLTAARKLYRYTIDVSDVMPVTIGTLRSWHAY
ncbi:peptidase S8, partial [Pectobacterium versatile]|nr:peptidase S8 [Pectobacterium versatile]